jgi:hypothetical protein
VVTHPSTGLTITSLSMGERTGSRVFWYLWSYVSGQVVEVLYQTSPLCLSNFKAVKLGSK